MDEDKKHARSSWAWLKNVSVFIDLHILFPWAEMESMLGSADEMRPDEIAVATLGMVAASFPMQTVFVCWNNLPARRYGEINTALLRWLLRHDLFTRLKVKPEMVWLFGRAVQAQSFLVRLPHCKHVISGNAEHIKLFAGFSAQRYLLKRGCRLERSSENNLLRGVTLFPDWDALFGLLGIKTSVLSASAN